MRTSLTLCLVASNTLLALAPTKEFHPVASHAIQQMQSRIYDLGLDGNHTFAFRNIIEDADGTAHVRLDQSYRGVKVFEGEAIAHLRGGELIETTDALVRGLNLNPNPSIEAAEALAVAHGDLAPKGPYANPPIAELVFANVEREVPIGKRSLDSGNESTRTVPNWRMAPRKPVTPTTSSAPTPARSWRAGTPCTRPRQPALASPSGTAPSASTPTASRRGSRCGT